MKGIFEFMFEEGHIVHNGKPHYVRLSLRGQCVLAWIVVLFVIFISWITTLPVAVRGIGEIR